jgi:hypothetical protein
MDLQSKLQEASFLTCIREVLSSLIGWDTGYPDRGFSWFPLASSGKCGDKSIILPSVSFKMHYPP